MEFEKKIGLSRIKKEPEEEKTPLPSLPSSLLVEIEKTVPKGKGRKKKKEKLEEESGKAKISALAKKALSRKYAENREEKRIREASESLSSVDIGVGDSKPIRQIADTAQKFIRQEHERLQHLREELIYLLGEKPEVDVRTDRSDSKKPAQTYEQMLQDFSARIKTMETKVLNLSQTINTSIKKFGLLDAEVELLKQRDTAVRSQVRTAGQALFNDFESYARFHGGLGIVHQ